MPIIVSNNLIGVIGILGAVAPDWDILLGIKHRTITHSLIALCVSTLIVALVNTRVGLVWCISYLTHLILDSFTKMGVPLFYPCSKKYYGLKLIKTGGVEDLFLCLVAFYIVMLMLK